MNQGTGFIVATLLHGAFTLMLLAMFPLLLISILWVLLYDWAEGEEIDWGMVREVFTDYWAMLRAGPAY